MQPRWANVHSLQSKASYTVSPQLHLLITRAHAHSPIHTHPQPTPMHHPPPLHTHTPFIRRQWRERCSPTSLSSMSTPAEVWRTLLPDSSTSSNRSTSHTRTSSAGLPKRVGHTHTHTHTHSYTHTHTHSHVYMHIHVQSPWRCTLCNSNAQGSVHTSGIVASVIGCQAI